MCSEDGRSVTAPPIMVPSRGLVLDAPSECAELLALLQESPGDERGGSLAASGDSPPRAMPSRAFVPLSPLRGRTGIERTLLPIRPGAPAAVYRPPKGVA